MNEPKPGLQQRWTHTTYAKPPSRNELRFQILDGFTTAKKKLRNLPNDREHQEIYFCPAEGDFFSPSDIDVDHMAPYREVIENQTKLLAFLNDINNKSIVSLMMREPGMSDFFIYHDGNIVGTRNISICSATMPLKTYCYLAMVKNIKKSDNEPIAWLSRQAIYLGDEFHQSVQEAGGCHPGLLFSRVYQETHDMRRITVDGAAPYSYIAA